MKLTPEQFGQIFNVFVLIILVFMAFGGVKIAMFEHRRRHPEPPPRRPPGPPGSGTGEYRGAATAATFGTSGIGASEMAPAGIPDLGSSTETASADLGGTDMSGGDSGDGGGDFSGGGGDYGGGGSSGSWS